MVCPFSLAPVLSPIYHVILIIDPDTGEYKTGIMFNRNGVNWSEELVDTTSLLKKYSVS